MCNFNWHSKKESFVQWTTFDMRPFYTGPFLIQPLFSVNSFFHRRLDVTSESFRAFSHKFVFFSDTDHSTHIAISKRIWWKLREKHANRRKICCTKDNCSLFSSHSFVCTHNDKLWKNCLHAQCSRCRNLRGIIIRGGRRNTGTSTKHTFVRFNHKSVDILLKWTATAVTHFFVMHKCNWWQCNNEWVMNRDHEKFFPL